jgi:spermidine synthase
MNKTLLLFAVIILEGYAVLSAEMLAIRQTIPFVGSGTDTFAIIIAAVLMPLAFGYYAGGKTRLRRTNGMYTSVRKRLLLNIIISQAIFVIGLSYLPVSIFFFGFNDLGITNRLVLTALYSVIFLSVPVFLLGQTIPLISHYFSKEKLSRITGRILFFSTFGSFAGAVLPSIFLMTTIGVGMTVVVLSTVMTVLTLLLSKKRDTVLITTSLFLTGLAFILNAPTTMKSLNIVSDNRYNTVMVIKDAAENRHMILNLTASSMYNDRGEKHKYIEFLERVTLANAPSEKPLDILIVGAGAFTYGIEDNFNNFHFIDMDGTLKKIAEEYILQKKLGPNKHFHVAEARAYLASDTQKYDIIILDAYNGDLTLPENLVTREFLQTVKDHLKPNGVMAGNYIASPNFLTPFSRHLDNTIRSVFPHVSRHVIDEDYRVWETDPRFIANLIYIYKNNSEDNATDIYTDDRNRVFYDKPHSRQPAQQ